MARKQTLTTTLLQELETALAELDEGLRELDTLAKEIELVHAAARVAVRLERAIRLMQRLQGLGYRPTSHMGVTLDQLEASLKRLRTLTATAETPDRVRLLQILRRHFDEEELRELCFHLHVRYEDLAGSGRSAKARSLIEYLERRDQLPELVQLLHQLRPDTLN